LVGARESAVGWGTRKCSWLGHAKVQLVEVLRHKTEGSGVRFPTGSFGNMFYRFHPLREMGNRGKGSQWRELTISPPSCADSLEILGASTSWSAENQLLFPLKISGLPPLWNLLPHPNYVPGQNYCVFKPSELSANFTACIYFSFGFIQTRRKA